MSKHILLSCGNKYCGKTKKYEEMESTGRQHRRGEVRIDRTTCESLSVGVTFCRGQRE